VEKPTKQAVDKMSSPSKRYLIVYLVILIVAWILTLIVHRYYLEYNAVRTTRKLLKTAADADLTLKAACAVLLASEGNTIVAGLYPPGSVGIQKCHEILAANS
jgi:hypothetical protein